MKTCGQCKFYEGLEESTDGRCKGHPPIVMAIQHGSRTEWPTVISDEKACYKFAFETAEEDNREDTEILYEYLRMGKRRTMKQLETYFDSWDFNRLTNALNALKATGMVTSKQQGIAFYWVCIDENAKLTKKRFNTREFLLSTIPQDKNIHNKELIKLFKEASGKAIDDKFFTELKQLAADKFIRVINTDEGQYYTKA